MNQEKDRKQSIKRTLVEWGLILGMALVLYVTGLHTEVIGRIQQAILWTGLMQPETEMPEQHQEAADLDMPLIGFEGEPVNLARFRGNVVFINFWATWCPPCIAEMPGIQSLYESFEGEDRIRFLMVSLDENKKKAREFIERKEFTFPVYMLAGRRPDDFRSGVIPSTFVVDKQGRIAMRSEGMASYDTDHFKSYLRSLIAQ